MSNKLFNKELFESHSNSDMEKTVKWSIFAIIFMWLLGVIASLAFVGVIIWAIVKFVIKYTS